MAIRKFKIALSKGWTYMVCSLSVVVLALIGCRSKKVAKTADLPQEPDYSVGDVDGQAPANSSSLAQTISLPGDSKEVKAMIKQVNDLKKDLSKRMNSVIYGTPEAMQRRARENREMRAQIDSLDNAIQQARIK